MSYTRRSLQVIAFLATLIVGVASMAVIVTQTTWFKEWLRGFIVRQAEDYVNGRLSIGRLDGNLFFGIDLGDVDVTVNGEKVVDIDGVALDYNAFTLIRGDVALDQIRLTRPVLRLHRDEKGWNLAHLIKVRTPDPDEPKNRRTLEISEIGISDGTLYVEKGAVGTGGVDVPARIERLDATVAVRSDEDELTVDIDHVSLRAAEPGIGVNGMSGRIRRTPNEVVFDEVQIRTEESTLRVNGKVLNVEGSSPVVDVQASSDTLTLVEVANLFPALRGYQLQPSFRLTARGPADRMSVDVSMRDRRLGDVNADLVVDGMAPGRRVAGTATVSRLNVEALTRNPPERPSPLASDISGRARFDLLLPEGAAPVRGTYAVDASRVRIAGYEASNIVADGRIDGTTVRVNARGNAYGGHATAVGVVRAGTLLALDLRGRASNVDLRNLPPALRAPRASSNLRFAYTLTGRGREFSGTAAFEQSTIAGASIAEGTMGAFAFGAGAPSFSAKGQVADVDVERVGREFGIEALATERYRSAVNGTFDVSGSGGGSYPLTIDVTGTLVDSRIFGATFPRMDVTTSLSDGDVRVRTTGSFSGLDPAIVTDDERASGMLAGSVDAETTIRGYASGVTPESIDVAGRVELAGSMIGMLAIDSALVDGRYAAGEAHVTALQVTGADVNVTGQGTLALNESGASSFMLHAETASLDRLGEIVGRPLKGAVVTDVVVTGNRGVLKADGTLKGSNVGYGDSEALSLESKFSAAVPDLELARVRVEANSTATFLEVGGQKVNQLTADTTYSASRLDFTAAAQQERRELAAGGAVILHPDHHEMHVRELALRAEQIEWRTPAGSQAAIRYGGDVVEVDRLTLANGDQQIEASGAVGEGRSLQVRATNVDVAQLDTLLLGDGRVAGRFSADATVSGPTNAPAVTSKFTLAQGAFRNFTFDAFAGTVDYTPTGLKMDVRLQQSTDAWFTAKGTAPLTLFQPTPPDVDRHDTSAGGAVDIAIATSTIDLGIVQGFTSYVTNVTGTLQANIRVTGTGYDPHAEGAIDIRGGSFAVPEFGTRYSGLDTRIELSPDVVTVQEFKILDDRGFPMTVGGTLAVHERAVGAVNIAIQSKAFEVIDNKLADLKLNTQLQITGELRKPRIEGTIETENATIHLAELIEQVTANPYSTEETAAGIRGSDAAAREVEPPTGDAQPAEQETPLFDALELEIAVAVPNNMVLRGNSLRPANAPIEIGDMNVTVGGQVRVQKASGGEMRFTGDVNTVRGSYNFQGRRFDIERDGHIRFDGSDELDPALNLRARREISGVETFVNVQGTMRQPELSFTSNPPLDQADILSLIVFNQPLNELAEGQQVSLTERATALAGGYVASGIARSIGNALELDEFEIQTGDTANGATLSVGEQVGEHFFFRIRQGFGEAQATELILEYQVKDYLRAVGTIAEPSDTRRETFRRIERGGLDLIFFFSY